MKILKRYRMFLIVLGIIGVITLFNRTLGTGAINLATFQLREMLLIIPPIFVLLGLLDVWVPRDIIVKFMGEGSGVKGIFLSFFLGSAAAGPLYGAFPVAAVLMKKGVKFTNILIMIGAWSTMKIPMFLFEIGSLGAPFAITRLILNIPGVMLIAYILSKIISRKEEKEIYANSQLNIK